MCAVNNFTLSNFRGFLFPALWIRKDIRDMSKISRLASTSRRLNFFSLFSMPVCNSRSVFESLIGRLEDLSYQTIEWYVRPLGLVFFPVFGFELIINQSSFALLARWC